MGSMDCWKFLHDNYGGGPVLTDEDCCLSCAITLSDERTANSERRVFRQKMQQKAQNSVKNQGFYVSSDWIKKFIACKSNSEFEDLDLNFNESITCEHGGLTVESNLKVLVSDDLWEYLKQAFSVGPEYKYDHQTCEICEANNQLNIEQAKIEKTKRTEERLQLLSITKPPPIHQL